MDIFKAAHDALPTRQFRKDLLVQLLTVQSYFRREHLMVEFLTQQLQADGFYVTADKHNNVYATKGYAQVYPCLASHIDTVQPFRNVSIVEHEDGRLTGVDALTGHQCGIGADCKTGVFTCLEIARRLPAVKVAFFACEEIGMVGAYQSDRAFFADVGYVIEFDCPSRGLASYTSGGRRIFDNQGEFIRTALSVLNIHGVEFQNHPFTDVKAVSERHGLQCLNLSSGYYNWHCQDEFAFIPDIKLAIETGEQLVKALGPKAYPRAEADSQDALMEVKRLQVPSYI